MPADDSRHTARKNSGRGQGRFTAAKSGTRPARKNTGRGQGRFTAAKERHTAGRATAAKKYSCKTCEKGGAGPITKRTAPAKQTEKVAGRPKALAVTVGGAWAGRSKSANRTGPNSLF